MPAALPPSPAELVTPDAAVRAGRAVRWLRRFRLAAIGLTVAGLIAIIVGFAWFVTRVPTDEIVLDRNADGIVVLTGGASRIADAVELLAAGHGRRLLITGVHGATTTREIARLMPAYGRWVACCVDLGHSAVNTEGNAVETRAWVKRRNFGSLIVVTSNYHMPRAMAELEQQLPDVALIPFPVVTDKQRAERWWTSPLVARLLVSEYLKYILAQVRIRLEPVLARTDADRRMAKG